MRLAGFDYHEPKTLGEALTILAQAGPKASVKAGGTDLLVRMKQRTAKPELLVNLAEIGELNYIDADGAGLRLGAMTSLRSLETSPVILQRFPTLAEAIGKIASLEIRNVATIGGNVGLDARCWYFNQSHFWRQTHPPCFKTGGQVCHIAKRSKKCNALFSADSVPVLIALGTKIRLA
ncbi:MAG: FAD binding domain-containing protein, partial [Chloroflexi bacterium]|nr:FAD binding domain-containing protein [Chloroflexota bacterium]